MNCQKCRQPLKLDSSLQDLNPAAFDLLVCTSKLQRFMSCKSYSNAVQHSYSISLDVT